MAKNRDYWKKRFEQLEQAANKEALTYLRELEKQYLKALQEIEAQINTWYRRFAVNNQIDMSEARRLLNTKELAEFKWTVEDYIRFGEANELNQLWMKQLENASARFHISRLEALKVHIQQSLETLFDKQLSGIDDLMKRIYMEDYYKTLFEVQKGFNVAWDIASVDQNKLSKIISKPWAVDGKNFSERIWTNKTKLISELHNELTQMTILGKGPDEAIQNIAQKMNTSKNNAGRLVMTEQSYFSTVAQGDAFRELGVERYEIVATLDDRTSEICQELDGKVFEMKDFEAGVTAPPFHVWCRTVVAPYFDDDFGKRAARGVDGEVYYVPGNITYKQWKEKHVK